MKRGWGSGSGWVLSAPRAASPTATSTGPDGVVVVVVVVVFVGVVAICHACRHSCRALSRAAASRPPAARHPTSSYELHDELARLKRVTEVIAQILTLHGGLKPHGFSGEQSDVLEGIS